MAIKIWKDLGGRVSTPLRSKLNQDEIASKSEMGQESLKFD